MGIYSNTMLGNARGAVTSNTAQAREKAKSSRGPVL